MLKIADALTLRRPASSMSPDPLHSYAPGAARFTAFRHPELLPGPLNSNILFNSYLLNLVMKIITPVFAVFLMPNK